MSEAARHRPVGRGAALLRPVTRWTSQHFVGRRGTVQLALLVIVAAVLGGLAVGTGVAGSSVKTGYDLAWLGDSGRGQVVQVDPQLGRANVRLQVAAKGADLDVQQRNGQLVVVDRRTGKVTSVNMGTLLLSGSRTATAGAVKVLLGAQRMYVVDLARGTVQAADPSTTANIGKPWPVGRSVIDAGIDGHDQLWVLDSSQHVIGLRWDSTHNTLARAASYAMHGAGPGSVVVAHEQGVTVIGGQGGVARIGTGHDTNLVAGQVSGPLAGPRSSPDSLVPVADPKRSAVIIVGNDDVRVDDVGSLGCAQPKAPTVFQGKIYVPCAGANKVVVLDAQGNEAGSAIATPGGGDPQLTVSGDKLIVDTPGAGQAKIVDGDGHSRDFRTFDPRVPVQNPHSAPPPPPAPPAPDSDKKSDRDRGHGDVPVVQGNSSTGHDQPDAHHSDPAPPSESAAPPDSPGASASATVRSDGSVLVGWDGPQVSGGYTVTTVDSSAPVAQVPHGSRSATVTVLDAGSVATFVVHARDSAGRDKWTATTNTVTVTGAPGGVTGLSYTVTSHDGGKARVTVRWSAAQDNGGRVSYTLGASSTPTTTSTNATSASLDIPCDTTCSGTFTVTPANSSGHGTAGKVDYSVGSNSAPPAQNDPPAQQPPANNDPPAQQPPANNDPPAQPPVNNDPPAPPPMPAGGEQAITATSHNGSSRIGPAYVDLTITMPSDYAGFGGTCTLVVDDVAVEDLSCTASGETRSYDYEATDDHTYKITAHDSSRSVDSAVATAHVNYVDVPCYSNFAAGAGPHAMPPCNECPQDPRQPRQICPNPFRASLDTQSPSRPSSLADRIATGLVG